jgi:hypothetical protein
MPGLRRITTTTMIQEFVALWSMLREIRLEHQPDATVALHAKCEVVCKVGILGSVPGLVHRS